MELEDQAWGQNRNSSKQAERERLFKSRQRPNQQPMIPHTRRRENEAFDAINRRRDWTSMVQSAFVSDPTFHNDLCPLPPPVRSIPNSFNYWE